MRKVQRLATLTTIAVTGWFVLAEVSIAQAQTAPTVTGIDYKLLATSRTSTMQKEMQEAADAGFKFEGVMGGDTAGGSEVVVIMSRPTGGQTKARYEYKLLATSRTSTMQKEMQQAGDAGFDYQGQTVFKSAFGGKETVVILGRDKEQQAKQRFEYRLLATKRTSTMQKELSEAGEAGFVYVGVTVGDTAIGGAEVIVILRRPVLL